MRSWSVCRQRALVFPFCIGTLTALACVSSQPTETMGPGVSQNGNSLRIRTVPSSPVLGGARAIEFELTSDRPFPVRNALLVLQVGQQTFSLSRYRDGDLHSLIFTLAPDEFARLGQGDPVIVRYDPDPPESRWDFGRLDKSKLDR